MVDEPTVLSDLEAAIRHGAAVVLAELISLGRGYTTLTASGPAVAKGVEAANTEAQARGVTEEITAPVVMAKAQELGAASVDPLAIVAGAGAAAATEQEAGAAIEVSTTGAGSAEPPKEAA